MEQVVFKKHLEDQGEITSRFNGVRLEAEVTSAVSASPNNIDMYGYCHVSVLIESAPLGTASKMAYRGLKRSMKKRKRKHGDSNLFRNNLTLSEKLHYTLEAAKGIRDLHAAGFAHEDLKLSQFLLTKDGTGLKLNDFNIARKLVWNNATQSTKPYKGPPMPDYVSLLQKKLVRKLQSSFLTNPHFYHYINSAIHRNTATDVNAMKPLISLCLVALCTIFSRVATCPNFGRRRKSIHGNTIPTSISWTTFLVRNESLWRLCTVAGRIDDRIGPHRLTLSGNSKDSSPDMRKK